MPKTPPVDLKPYFLTLHDLDGVVDWPCYFGNDRPVEIDVGSGRGLFLVNAGLAHPEINYVGIELDYREGRRAARRLKKREMPNVRVWGGRRQNCLRQACSPAFGSRGARLFSRSLVEAKTSASSGCYRSVGESILPGVEAGRVGAFVDGR